ncbi:unnamed protein product [Pleuronectes platessa]|uniref:Uncharacterized protein n=1 Tax=Pleuronectes platessa TaxID=8262 RepID=A0A9N7V094_PLEPL|nr:unnamed protein product [Pleuronectes platessa]
MFSLAVSIPLNQNQIKNQNQNQGANRNIEEVLGNNPADDVKNKINMNEVYPKDGSVITDAEHRDSLERLGEQIGLKNIFRCDRDQNKQMKCVSCSSSSGNVAQRCVSDTNTGQQQGTGGSSAQGGDQDGWQTPKKGKGDRVRRDISYNAGDSSAHISESNKGAEIAPSVDENGNDVGSDEGNGSDLRTVEDILSPHIGFDSGDGRVSKGKGKVSKGKGKVSKGKGEANRLRNEQQTHRPEMEDSRRFSTLSFSFILCFSLWLTPGETYNFWDQCIDECPAKYFTSTYDVRCSDRCEKHGYDYYWCHSEEGWDYCSPGEHIDYIGNPCSNACGKYGENFYRCLLWGGSWSKCARVEPRAMIYYTRYQRQCVDSCQYYESDDYFWCHDGDDWEYCSPLQDHTYKNEPCRFNHQCGRHDVPCQTTTR